LSALDDVREFLTVLAAQAKAALRGFNSPGVMQLSRLHPASEKFVSTRYRVDDTDRMVRAALSNCDAGHNVYVESRTVRSDLNGGRGELKDTVGVFALVVDSDGDKGMNWSPTIVPSLTVETSPGNHHYWFFLKTAVTAETGENLGERIRQAVKADYDTGTVTQPYRVAGTINYPSKAKIKRGRIATPTQLIACQPDRLWTVEAIEAQFPPCKTNGTPREPVPAGEWDRIITSTDYRDLAIRRLGGYLFSHGIDIKVTVTFVKDWNARHPPSLPDDKVIKILDRIAEKHAKRLDEECAQ
jgi:hypothetical protein